MPSTRNTVSEAALVLVAVPAPPGALLRPSELEDPALAAWLEREALFGDAPVLERGEATHTSTKGGSLLSRQSKGSLSVDEDGTVVVMRALSRGADRQAILRGIIEEEVLADLEADLAFVDRVLIQATYNGVRVHIEIDARGINSIKHQFRILANDPNAIFIGIILK